MAKDAGKDVGLPLVGTRQLTADEQAELGQRLQAESRRVHLGWACLWGACGVAALGVLAGHWLGRPNAPPLAGSILGLGVGTVLAAVASLLSEVVTGQGVMRWSCALFLPFPLVMGGALSGLVSKEIPVWLLLLSVFATFAGLAFLVLRIPDRRRLHRLLLAAEADVTRGEVQVYRGRWANSGGPSSEEQVLEFLPESRLLTRVNDQPVARPRIITGDRATLMRLRAELAGLAAGQVQWDKRTARIFLGELAVCAFVCTFWGVGCGDIFHPAGEASALGQWGPFSSVMLGLAVVVVLAVRHRKDKSEVRQALPFLVAILAIVAGWHARDRVAAEVWNLRCSSDWIGMDYCRTSAQKFGFFTSKIGNTDILGRMCIGSEYPFVLCRYYPRFDPPRCKQIADECTEIRRTTIRQYACVEQVCKEWHWRCQHGPIDDASPALREMLRRSHGAP